MKVFGNLEKVGGMGKGEIVMVGWWDENGWMGMKCWVLRCVVLGVLHTISEKNFSSFSTNSPPIYHCFLCKLHNRGIIMAILVRCTWASTNYEICEKSIKNQYMILLHIRRKHCVYITNQHISLYPTISCNNSIYHAIML